ncbi:uncharacterized protein LOC136035666 [Artemia franciscana]
MSSVEHLIIDFISSRPYLYNPKNDNYKDRHLKINAWESFSNQLASQGMVISVTELQKKWVSLRERYVRLKKISKLPSGSAALKTKAANQEFIQRMDFLRDVIIDRSRKTIGNCVSSLPVINVIEQQITEDYSEEIDFDITHSPSEFRCVSQEEANSEEFLIETESPQASTSIAPDEHFQTYKNVQKRNRTKTEGSTSSATDEAILSYLSEKQKRDKNKVITMDEDQHFLMSLVSFMKDIPAEEKLQCRMKIMNAILEHTKKR